MTQLELLHDEPETRITERPLLFIHGAWHGAWCWDINFLPYFAEQGFEVYAFSLRGHGANPRMNLRFVSIADYLADLRAVLRQIREAGKPDPVLIGHSMGGYIIQKHLETATAAAAALLASVPVSGTLAFSLRLFRFVPQAPAVLPEMLLTASLYPLVKRAENVKLLVFSDDMPLPEVERFTALLNDESVRLTFESGFLALPQPQRVNVPPMVVIAAEDDALFTVAEERRTADAYNADFVLLPDMAHDLMLDTRWPQAADALRDWLIAQPVVMGVE